jgi:hypothetical protein
MSPDVPTTRVGDGSRSSRWVAHGIDFDEEMGDALTQGLEPFAGDATGRVVRCFGTPYSSAAGDRSVIPHGRYSLPFSGIVVCLTSRECRTTARRRVSVLPLGLRATRCTDPDGS